MLNAEQWIEATEEKKEKHSAKDKCATHRTFFFCTITTVQYFDCHVKGSMITLFDIMYVVHIIIIVVCHRWISIILFLFVHRWIYFIIPIPSGMWISGSMLSLLRYNIDKSKNYSVHVFVMHFVCHAPIMPWATCRTILCYTFIISW